MRFLSRSLNSLPGEPKPVPPREEGPAPRGAYDGPLRHDVAFVHQVRVDGRALQARVAGHEVRRPVDVAHGVGLPRRARGAPVGVVGEVAVVFRVARHRRGPARVGACDCVVRAINLGDRLGPGCVWFGGWSAMQDVQRWAA